jgi:hypothetical protein
MHLTRPRFIAGLFFACIPPHFHRLGLVVCHPLLSRW